MAAPHDDEEDEKPLDPAVEKVRRKLVRFIVINLGILFIALMAVVVALVYRATQAGGDRPLAAESPVPGEGGALEGRIDLPPGARVAGHSLSGNVLSLLVEHGDARAIHLYDIHTGRLVGRFTLAGAQ